MFGEDPKLLDSAATLVPSQEQGNTQENCKQLIAAEIPAPAACFDDPDELFAALLSRMRKYHPSTDFTLVTKAYDLAREAHEGQKRKSGEPYIIHPVAVATILANLEMDRETIAAGILHDIIEDTDYTYQDLAKLFSEEVANLVDGVTKLKKYAADKLDKAESEKGKEQGKKIRREASREEEQAENFRKMFLAMAYDIRVIIIKIADRLHNLQTLNFMPEHKQKRIAQESLDIYAPLAGRLGISTLRREIEDIAFRYCNNEAYLELKDKINMKRSERLIYVEDIVGKIKKAMKDHGLDARVEGRPKHFFSIYKKMKQKELEIDQIFDLFAVRIILNTEDKNQCYIAMGAVNSVFIPVSERFKDYVAVAKGNGYQSLHNTLVGPGGEFFEAQIRTEEMHRVAEYGIAAHWKYKENKEGSDDGSEVKLAWLRQILELHVENPENEEYMEALKDELDVYTEFVNCFTPQGEPRQLVKGSTCIDFAFAIHTAVGTRMTGTKVNGRMQTLDYVIQGGDQIEILTSNVTKGPTHDWLKMVKTNQAKSKIKQWLKKSDKEENIGKGKSMLEAASKRKGITLAKLLTPEAEKMILDKHSYHDIETLFASVGRGAISENTIVNRLCAEYLLKNPEEAPDIQEVIDEINSSPAAVRPEKIHTGDVIVRGEGDVAVSFAKCCGAVPGDEIVALITRGRGASIHRIDCKNIINMNEIEAMRLIDAEWNAAKAIKNNFHVELNIICDNRELSQKVSKITEVLSKLKVGLKGMQVREVGEEAVVTAAINVGGREELEYVTNKLSTLRGVHEVSRVTVH
ncbi:MAG: bifunctional (p)ppGpp synthetase/guanosine-3',5'-bis(diphosphate) 3'-pyrophosphohydrolase [Defluviitaleaceae bacterium]|nr:bifunctional (p)ppGpp synthetase/guanosine-3',5'-bis(diphosphate) 3'-pyrophosphohydrolase [Defluviitaleaceae bacterium]